MSVIAARRAQLGHAEAWQAFCSWFLLQPPSDLHGIGHTARVMVWAAVLTRGTPWVEPVVCHAWFNSISSNTRMRSFHYFGPWSDPTGALAKYQEQKTTCTLRLRASKPNPSTNAQTGASHGSKARWRITAASVVEALKDRRRIGPKPAAARRKQKLQYCSV